VGGDHGGDRVFAALARDLSDRSSVLSTVTASAPPGRAGDEAAYVWVASGLTADRFPLDVDCARTLFEWLNERSDGEGAARLVADAVLDRRDVVFSAEQRAVVFDELHLRWEEPSRWFHFRRGLIDLYFELLVEFWR
jgi:hypothetical protein